jgi:hypothetical protein
VEGRSLHDRGGRAPQGKGVEISSREIAASHTYKKSVTPRPYHPQASARAAPPRPKAHNDNVGDEQRELQRLFPQSRWPGQQ